MGETNSEATTPSRKRKEITESESPEKKAKVFCCRTFRRDLKGSETLKSLKSFISAAKSSGDVLDEYLENGGSVQEILSVIDATATGDLTTALPVFEAVHLILLRFQSTDSKYHERCIESARNILRSYLHIIKAMLTMNVTKQKKVALKLLTAIATLDSSFANEIINVVALSPTLITSLTQPSSEKDSVRKCFILFLLSFLVEGSGVVVKILLEKKGFLSSIVPGLKYDDAYTVNLTLSLFEEKILRNVKIQKTLKLKLFNTQVIKCLFDLYDWKGGQGLKQLTAREKNKGKEVEINQADKEIVVESVHSFLLLLCSSQKHGVAFHDKSMGTSEQLNNQLLLTVFESLSDPLKNKKVAEVITKTIACCPDLMKPVLVKLEPFFLPRKSKNWFQAVDFAENLIKEVDASVLLKTASEEPLTPNYVIKVAKALCAPVAFLRLVKTSTQKTQPVEVQLRGLNLLAAIWTETQKLVAAFPSFPADWTKPLRKYVVGFLPDADDLVRLWQNLCDAEFFAGFPGSQDTKTGYLISVLESLLIAVKCQREFVSSPLGLASDLLSRLESLKGTVNKSDFERMQVKIVEFVELDLESLTPEMELFEKSLLILFRSTDESSVSYLSKMLSSLRIFKGVQTEVDVWLVCYLALTPEQRDSAAGYFIKSIRRCLNEEKAEVQTEEGKLVKPAPLLVNCLEMLASYSAKSPKKEQKTLSFRHYVNDVLVHLQHFYALDVHIYDCVKTHGKTIDSSICEYLKSWKNPSKHLDFEIFRYRPELELVSWLNGNETRAVRDIVRSENLLVSFSFFKLVLAFLTRKITSGVVWSAKDAEKYAEALSACLVEGSEDESPTVDLISANVRNVSTYRRHCLECLCTNETLLKGFDVFQKKDESTASTTEIFAKVVVEGDAIKSGTVKRNLAANWKEKFLKQLKGKERKKKNVDGSKHFKKVLNYFDYEETEVKEMVDILTVADLDLFAGKNSASDWVFVLSKFVRLHCRREELDGVAVRRLCELVKYLNERFGDSNEMMECFVDLLRTHPSHLLYIEKEFVEVVLQSGNVTSTTSTLAKLLLNDPVKVDHFMKFATDHIDAIEDPQLLFSILSAFAVDDSLPVERNPMKSFEFLKIVYKKLEKRIQKAMAGEKDGVILSNLRLVRELIRLFYDKESSKLKKEMVKGNLEPELCLEAVKKWKTRSVFVEGILSLFCRIAKDVEEEAEWDRYSSVVEEALALGEESRWRDAMESKEWKEFAKLAVGHSLSSGRHPSLLKIFRLLVTAFYEPEPESEDCALFFQMLISHSQFLKVVLSDSPLKSELVQLFFSLVSRCPSQMSPKHFPILLASYSASLSLTDVTLLKVLRLYEKRNIGVSDYEPFVWGSTAVSHYSIGGSSRLSLWQRFNMGNVLDLLDGDRLELSLKEFPLRRGLETEDDDGSLSSAVYDPAFLLPLFSNLLSPGSVVLCLSFIYKGGLAYTVRALSSERNDIRSAAAIVLTRFYNHLEFTRSLKQKLVWMHFINCLRFGIENLEKEPLPNIASLFFARMTLELSRHPAEMFAPLQNFLLAKSFFGYDVVPEFLPLVHSSEVGYGKHRAWLLEVMRDGTRAPADLKLIYHSMALKVVFCLFHSQLCDNEARKLILQVVEKILRLENGLLLLSEYGVLNWVAAIDSNLFHGILHELVNLLSTLADVIIKDIKLHKSKHSTPSHLIRILNMAMSVLPTLKQTKSADCCKIHVTTIKKCCSFFDKNGKTDWFKLNRNRLPDLVDVGLVLRENYNCGKLTKLPFYFREFDGETDVEDLKLSVFMFNKLINL